MTQIRIDAQMTIYSGCQGAVAANQPSLRWVLDCGCPHLAASSESVAAGEIVKVNGIIRNDVDLGSGYLYKVLLEEATFSK